MPPDALGAEGFLNLLDEGLAFHCDASAKKAPAVSIQFSVGLLPIIGECWLNFHGRLQCSVFAACVRLNTVHSDLFVKQGRSAHG